MTEPGQITTYLERLRQGDNEALDKLIPLVYAELRALAQSQLNFERTDHTLSATGLVHEVYVRLTKQQKIRAEDRLQFLGIAGTTMRRVLVDWARGKRRAKRGGGVPNLPLDELDGLVGEEDAAEVLALDEALDRLAAANPRGAKVVEQRFFAGLSVEETAALLGVSERTIKRDWFVARAWLRKEVGDALGAELD
ncbi:MAG: ECF-type sigma factor [Gemmatimonadetes bacterium]|nr:ECF-type sigma factor [Gemmatimonadota bacterium]